MQQSVGVELQLTDKDDHADRLNADLFGGDP